MVRLKKIFCPESVAVIGASREKGAVGNAVLSNIVFGDYKGVVFPVNPKAKSILGIKCYPSIKSVPGQVDMAVIVVPGAITPKVVDECGRKGVKGLVIISAGFKEIGGKGAELQTKVVSLAKKYNMALVGPNCLGIINTDPSISLNASFGKYMPLHGKIGLISQSGALCTAILDHAKSEGMGFSKFISFGNKADLSEVDFLSYLGNDPQTKAILLYVEDLTNTREFMRVARQITTGEHAKPIIAVKSGRTSEGCKAALSHTGALAGSDAIYDALFAQSGVLRVDSVEHLLATAIAVANMPMSEGCRTAIVTNAGGLGVIAADASIKHGLELPALKEKTVRKLRKVLPNTASLCNPVDLIGDARSDRYEAALRIILKSEEVDSVIVLLTPQSMTDVENIARVVVKLAKGTKKPILCSFMGAFDVSGGIKILEQNKIPHYRFPEKAARVLGHMNKCREWRSRQQFRVKKFDVNRGKAAKVIEGAKRARRRYLPEIEALEVLNAYGFPTLQSQLCKNLNECTKAANEIGYPVAMKIVSPDIVHKFDVGGVILKLGTDEEIKKAYENLMRNVRKRRPNAKIWGVNIQEMAKGGQETIIGAERDKLFGPVIMFGLGGIYAEAIKDVSFAFAPLKPPESKWMIESVKSYKILAGMRGCPPSDIDAIGECLLRLSQLIVDFPEISELDINPLIVYPKGCKVADVRIILK
jgi:acetyltransferase